MNHIYRLVWSTVTHGWIAVAETARGRGKGARRRLVAAALSVASLAAQAGPTGGQVVAGSGSIAQSGTTTTITQATPSLSLNWNSFNIAPQETVNFVQPSSTAIAVNRIFDTNGTQILGHLNANGQVFLINPNGILFGEGAQVNVGGLVASTLDWSGAATGNSQSFSGTGGGSVVNRGTITAADGGYVALLGSHVENQGVIGAQLGSVALGAGSAVTLTFDGRSLIHAQVDQSLLNSLAENGGLIRADGGQVIMTAGAKDALLASVVNNSGTIEARTVGSQSGRIVLLGGMIAGTDNVGGTLDASAPNGGQGGFIETSAAQVRVGDGAKVTTLAANGASGTWLIDPTNFTISAGSASQTSSGIGATTLESSLAGGNVSIATSAAANGSDLGDINLNAPVTWSANKLTLTAANDVNINAVMTLNNSAALDLEPGSGKVNMGMDASGAFLGQINFFQADGVTPRSGTGFLTIGNNPYTVITSLGVAADATSAPVTATLQGIAAASNLGGYFALGSNIDASATASWSGGFAPIGNGATGFSGAFDGLGHTISNLTISRPLTSYVGLFGYGTTIRNVGLVGASISGGSYTGGLIGYNIGTITNSYVTGSVSGGKYTGGLVGNNAFGSSISNSYVTGSVTGADYTGGLTGKNFGAITNTHAAGSVSGASYTGGLVGYGYGRGSITNSYTTANVNGNSGVSVGGLVGKNYGIISNSYSTGTVSGTDNGMGGLVGANYGTISNSFATGNVNGVRFAGGLVGSNSTGGTITNSYATGNVSGADYVGGLAGQNSAGTMANTYATGSATGANYVGGLLGQNDRAGTVTDSYSSGSVSASLTGAGGMIGITKNGATASNSFWDVTTSGQSGSAGGTGMSTAQMQAQANFTSATAVNGSANPGWNFSFAWVMYDGHTYPLLRSFMTNLVVTTNTAAKTYDGTAYADANGVTYSTTPNGNLLGTSALAFTDGGQPIVNAGIYTNALPGGLYSNQQGYIITYAAGTVTVNKATLSVSGESAGNKVYDTNNTATLSGGTLVGVVGSDAVTLNQAGTFASVNVGSGIAVTAADSLSGAAAGNYTLVQPSGLAANITPASLVVTGISAGNKVYDTTADAALSGTPIVTALGSDVVTVAGTGVGNFADPNVGNGKSVTVNGYTLSGAAAGNYNIVEPVGLSANITPASLTISGQAAVNKVYDATNTATLSGGNLVGVLGSDSVTLTQAGTFASKNAGNGIAVTASDSLGGAAAGNYVLTQPTGLAANITPASLTVSGETASNKVYDATNAATLSGGTLVGVFGGDAVTLNQSGTFATKNVGNGITVTASDSLGGAASGNYVLTQPSGLSANITPAALTVGGETAANKVYDATTAATVSGGTLVGVLGGDVVTLNQAGAFATKNAGNGITVTTADSLGGPAAGNYVLAQPSGLSANITPASLSVSGETAATKVYDTTTAAALSGGALVGVLGGDTVTLSQAGTFASKNVGNGISVTANDSLGGVDAGNYIVTQPAGLAANITPASVVLNGLTVATRVYDGTTAATLSGTPTVLALGSDVLTISGAGTGAYADPNAGSNKPVSVSGYTLSGAAASNYTLTQVTGVTGTVTPASLSVSGETAANKIYDSTTAATLTGGTLVGVIGGDAVTLNQTGVFASKNVGSAIAVTASDTLGGAAAGNYTLVQPGGLSANITPANLTVSGETAASKVYDGTTAATLSSGKLVGVFSGDSVALTQSGAFASKNAGTGVAVTTTDSIGGAGASNYVLVQPTAVTGNITPATLTVSGETAASKIYDGTTGATLSGGTLLGVIGGDAVTLTQSGNFASKNVGTSLTVTAADTLAGTAAGDYVLIQPAGLTASITPATLTYTASPTTLASGSKIAGLTGNVNGFVPGDSLAASTSGTLAWTTTAGSASAPGVYAIDGSGLTSSNYVFAQAGTNANALTLKTSAPSVSSKNVTTAVYATLPSSQTNLQQAMQNATPTTVVTKLLNTDGAIAEINEPTTPGEEGGNSGANKVGSIDPILRIVRSGIKLPDDSLNLNE